MLLGIYHAEDITKKSHIGKMLCSDLIKLISKAQISDLSGICLMENKGNSILIRDLIAKADTEGEVFPQRDADSFSRRGCGDT